MFDIKAIRETPERFDAGWEARGVPPQAARLLELDETLRALVTELQDAQTARNEASKKIGAAKASGDEAAAAAVIAEVSRLKAAIQAGEERQREAAEALRAALSELPNIPDAAAPVGPDEAANEEIRAWGAPARPDAAQEHFDLGEALGLLDFETAAQISGARFAILRGALARLERALGNFMIDLHTEEFGYEEIAPPLLVRDDALFGSGQLPKFAEDLFVATSGHSLIPTAEVPLANLVRERILTAEELPLRFAAWTPCFRSEAGSAGRDTRGLIRMHQFSKVELVSVTAPDASAEEHERMTACAEEVLKRLGLAYRVMTLSTGDMGFAASKTYDLEVWLPGQNRYREISSCSTCGDFQARRMNARMRAPGEKATHFVHTLNGSGLAVGRTLVALLETYQQPGGAIAIPDALRPYMGGAARIEKA
ncbi:MAG: serine--tRNA ligase [Pseudomonadota bacterium]